MLICYDERGGEQALQQDDGRRNGRPAPVSTIAIEPVNTMQIPMTADKTSRIIRVLGIAVIVWGLSGALNPGSMSEVQKTSAWLSMLCGISFIGFCMAAMLRNPQRATRVLAVVGLGCSLIFLTDNRAAQV